MKRDLDRLNSTHLRLPVFGQAARLVSRLCGPT